MRTVPEDILHALKVFLQPFGVLFAGQLPCKGDGRVERTLSRMSSAPGLLESYIRSYSASARASVHADR